MMPKSVKRFWDDIMLRFFDFKSHFLSRNSQAVDAAAFSDSALFVTQA
ncbi:MULTISPECIES: hypothetical protein [unclassified Mesorhizobium]|nr:MULTISPECIES: hypothetical protein [unclassified Mesorhizobium]